MTAVLASGLCLIELVLLEGTYVQPKSEQPTSTVQLNSAEPLPPPSQCPKLRKKMCADHPAGGAKTLKNAAPQAPKIEKYGAAGAGKF